MSKEELLKTPVINLDNKTSFEKLRKFKHIYVASRPSANSFKELAELGIKKVINLKSPEEDIPGEKNLAIEAGLEYAQVPVEGCHALTLDKIRELNTEIDFTKNEPICIYCASGNRVSSWFANHLFLDHSFSEDEAISKAKEIGMDKQPMEEGTREILKSYKL